MKNYNSYQLINKTINLNESKRKTTMSILGIIIPIAAGYTSLTWPIYRAIRAAFDQKTQRCGIFRPNTTRRQVCMLRVKIETLEKIKSASKDPKVLKQVEKKLNKYKTLLSKENVKLAKKGQTGIEPVKTNQTKWF